MIPSGFIHVNHKNMNEKPCEVERRRGKGGERISCYQGNSRHGNYLINELLMNPTNMVLVKSCCNNYQSFIHSVLAGAAWAAWRSLRALTDGREQLAESMKESACLGVCSITPPSQLPGHSSTETACRPIHLTVPHCQRATQLASCHRQAAFTSSLQS